MSDKNLIQAAAKAAGISLVPYTWDKGSPWGGREGFTVAGEWPNEWKPAGEQRGSVLAGDDAADACS